MRRMLDAAMRGVRQRVQNLAARAVLQLVNDAAAVQRVQLELLAGEIRECQRVQPYGLSTVPAAGAHPAVVLCPLGDRTQALAIVVDDVRSRPTGGASGDVVLYDLRGNKIELKAGTITITAVDALAVNVAGNANVTVDGVCTLSCSDIRLGDATLRKLCDERLITYLATHVHSGVTAGASNTGAPTVAPNTGSHATAQVTAA